MFKEYFTINLTTPQRKEGNMRIINIAGKILQKAVERKDKRLVRKSMELLHQWQNKYGYNSLVNETIIAITALEVKL